MGTNAVGTRLRGRGMPAAGRKPVREIEFDLTPNGSEIKLKWRMDGYSPSFSKPIKLNADLLRNRSKVVRTTLKELNEYIRRNPDLKEERDPEWKQYCEAFGKIVDAGRSLRAALLQVQAGAGPLLEALAVAKADTAVDWVLKISCSDEDVTFPFGFVCDAGLDDVLPVRTEGYRPSRKDFEQFWLCRFKISMMVEGSGCTTDDLTIAPESLRALYALHRDEFEASVDYLGADRDNLRQFLKMRVGDHYDWNSAQRAWRSIDTGDSIVFVLAHSDGDYLELHKSRFDSLQFKDMLEKRGGTGATLLILNCCLSASGGAGASLLSAVARRGFCGLVGTEAEILNSKALLFGTRLLRELLEKAQPLGDAFDAVQSDEGLFPLNLFYTCYADRSFRLSAPMRFDA